VNGNIYKVHPNLLSMTNLKNTNEVIGLLENHSLPVVRSASLALFLDHVYDNLKKNPGYNGEGLTKI
jgi:hypothetical protein